MLFLSVCKPYAVFVLPHLAFLLAPNAIIDHAILEAGACCDSFFLLKQACHDRSLSGLAA